MARTFRQPTLRQIEVFKAVIETGTVSRAAETLNMSQPAASKLLSNLEADSGLELFERRSRVTDSTKKSTASLLGWIRSPWPSTTCAAKNGGA